MKIYTRVVIGADGDVLEEDSYEYAGSIDLAKSAGSPPPQPDYSAQAQAQGAANKETAIAQSVLGNPNVTNAYGQQTVTYQTDPTSGQLQSNVNQTLNPQQQALFDQQQRVNSGLGGIAEKGVGIVQDQLNSPLYTKTAEDMFQKGIASAGDIQTGIAGGGPIQRSVGGIDRTGIAAMPVNAGMTGQQAIMNRLAPQIERENAQRNQELANQGITLGSDAYKNSRTLDDQRHNDLTSQAALQGIGLDMTANQQGFNQGLASANFGLNQGQFANAAQAQQFGQNSAQGQFANAAQGQQFGQNQQSAQFTNTAAQQYLNDQMMVRAEPINTLNAVRSGSQVNVPQFQQYNGAGITPAPIMQGAQAQGAAAQNTYNANVASANSFNNGLYSLAGAAIMMSDRRLKSNIRRIGTHRSGFALYAYTIAGRADIGVMADEVFHVKPGAVYRMPSGYLAVDYGGL